MNFTIDILVSTVDQEIRCEKLIKRNNLKGNVLILNQCNNDSYIYEKSDDNNYSIKCVNDRGIGKSRNTNIFGSKSDICVIADDDMFIYNNYLEIINNEFNRFPGADLLVFNLDNTSENSNRDYPFRINYSNYKKYGAARYVFKRKSIIDNDILFSLNYGGGAKYQSGEDTLFLRDCLKNGLNIVKTEKSIASMLDDRESTWFKGFDEKFYFDKGALYFKLNKITFIFNAIQFSFRFSFLNKSTIKFKESLILMFKGAKCSTEFKSYIDYYNGGTNE